MPRVVLVSRGLDERDDLPIGLASQRSRATVGGGLFFLLQLLSGLGPTW